MGELLRRALQCRTDEERHAFVEALSPEERQALWNEIVEKAKEIYEIAQGVADQFFSWMVDLWDGLSEECQAYLRARAEEGGKDGG